VTDSVRGDQRDVIRREQQIDEYVATWNETDPELRAALIARVWTEDGYYADRGAQVRGHVQISANIDRVHRKFPDRIYGRTSGIYHHRDRARFEWAIIDPAGRPAFGGVAYAKFAADGRLRSVIGLFGPIPDEAR
jgi:hypothetical protein